MKKTYLVDSLLVVGGIQAHGCVRYTHSDRTEQLKGNTEKADWKTHKEVSNVNEQKALNATRIELERSIVALGTHLNGFGFVVPKAREKELNEVLKEVRRRKDDYNSSAKDTELTTWLSVFQVRSNDESVAAALYSKTADLLEDVAKALKDGNIDELRKALSAMRGLEQILPQERSRKLVSLVDMSRTRAREVVKQVKGLDEKKQAAVARNLMKDLESGVSGVHASFVEVMEELDLTAGVESNRVVES